MQALLKYDKNNGHFMLRPVHIHCFCCHSNEYMWFYYLWPEQQVEDCRLFEFEQPRATSFYILLVLYK